MKNQQDRWPSNSQCTSATGGNFPKIIHIDSPPKCVNYAYLRDKKVKRMTVIGTKGGLNAYADLTEEECWLLASILLEGIDD